MDEDDAYWCARTATVLRREPLPAVEIDLARRYLVGTLLAMRGQRYRRGFVTSNITVLTAPDRYLTAQTPIERGTAELATCDAVHRLVSGEREAGLQR